jgi:hypothetical protein
MLISSPAIVLFQRCGDRLAASGSLKNAELASLFCDARARAGKAHISTTAGAFGVFSAS